MLSPADEQRLRQWLGLPDVPWPPDHFTLLGLSPAITDAATIELHTLERMDRLRAYQLPYPELVTLAMNRLAMAMMELSDAGSRAGYAAQHTPPPVASPVPDSRRVSTATPAPAPTPLASASGKSPEWRNDVPMPEAIPLAESAPHALADSPPTRNAAPDAPKASPSVAESPIANRRHRHLQSQRDEPHSRAARRRVIARLVGIRRIVIAWRAIEPILQHPELDSAQAFEIRVWLNQFRQLSDAITLSIEPFATPGQPGSLVTALLRQPVPVALLQGMLPSQRDQLAADWRKGHRWLTERYRELRAEAESFQPPTALRRLAAIVREIERSPGYLLMLLAGMALLMGLIRSLRPS
ncbi:hypothetical protein [Tuwongella immobilis]|uniref:Uncharacterized protein n=1 Tax=Tuwongella immobilis TaxID=692036 RepID=A0A6C2YMG5_9BACT|nr:hypothetical protein [Tuwongella immobilis]VIP02313.1 unnamed protein product [Tuwongella immobilis]VTS01025.1 unnamed protein product [Tuwongella immobilis]